MRNIIRRRIEERKKNEFNKIHSNDDSEETQGKMTQNKGKNTTQKEK